MKKSQTFFAAANSYDGFKNFFPEIIPTRELSMLKILKGGPGTGKSTIMKKIEKKLGSMADRTEVFFCSSDPNSYDGLLFYFGENRVAIQDGTAPHTRDPELPGAVDSVVSLGEGWNEAELRRRRPLLMSLAEEKKIAYEKAYQNLRIFGIFDRNFKAVSRKKVDNRVIWNSVEDFYRKNISGSVPGKRDIRLISSFSSAGFKTLPTVQRAATRCYVPEGDATVRKLWLNALADLSSKRAVSHTAFPSVLDPNDTEALYFPEAGISVLSESIHGAVLIPTDSAERIADGRSPFEGTEKSYLDAAEIAFKMASKAHFEMESIYSSCMNFDFVEEIADRIVSQIGSFFL